MPAAENPSRTEPEDTATPAAADGEPATADTTTAGTTTAETTTAETTTADTTTADTTTAETTTAETTTAETTTAETMATKAAAGDVKRRVAEMLAGMGPVLGIDVGGTSTRAVLIEDGVLTQRFSSGPFNFLLDGDGVPRMAALVRAAHPAAVGIGVPGVSRVPDAAAKFAAAIRAASGVPARVASDATVGWLGAFVGGPGILVIAGTGSVAVGGGSYGELALAGGHGHLVGDEGSGYWIGRRALRAALAAAEGTGPQTVLGDAIAKAAGASLYELMVRVQRAPADRSELAGLAPVVGKCAEGPAHDPVARAILTDAVRELTGLVTALRRRFGELPVAAAGGVFGIASVWDAFQQATGAAAPLAAPEIGAALLAAQPAGA